MTEPQRTAVIFPGQGSHAEGMGDLVRRLRPELADLALELVDDDPFPRAGDATRYAQPAIYCASLAGWSLVDPDGVDRLAGHSLGEIAALAAAGTLSEEDGLRLVALRGRLMDQAAASAAPGGMLAMIGPHDEARALAERRGLVVANDNAPEQLVLSGPRGALESAAADARGRGLRTVDLRVAGAFHSPAMRPALERFSTALEGIELRKPRVPVMSCVTAAPFDHVRARLVEALVAPVRWREVLLALRAAGIARFVETGPGRVLTGLVRRTLEGVEATTAEEVAAARA